MRGARLHASKARSATSSKPADVQAVVDKTIAAFGQVDILVNNAGVTLGRRSPKTMPLDKWQKVDRHQPDRRVSVRAGGRPRHAEAAVGPHHQHRVDRRAARVGERPALRGYAASKAGLMGLTRELAASWGAPGHPRQRDRARASSTRAWPMRAIEMAEAVDQGDQPDPARRRRRRAQGRRRVSRRRRLELHHRPDRSSSTAAGQSRERPPIDAMTLSIADAARPGCSTTTTGCRPHMTYPRPAAARHPRR